MTKAFAVRILAVAAGLFLLGSAASAEEGAVDWKALQGAKVSLEKGPRGCPE